MVNKKPDRLTFQFRQPGCLISYQTLGFATAVSTQAAIPLGMSPLLGGFAILDLA
jgi:hypothetical protein